MATFTVVVRSRSARWSLGRRVIGSALPVVVLAFAPPALAANCDMRTLDVYVAQNPRDANAYVTRAQCLLQSQRGMVKPYYGNLVAATKDLETAIRLDPNNVAAHFEYARAAAFEGQNELAKIHFTSAIKLDPRSARSYAGRGWVEFNTCQVAEASADFNRAVALDRAVEREVANPAAVAAQRARCAAPSTPPIPAVEPNTGFRCGQNAMLWCQNAAVNALTADKRAWIESCTSQKIAQCN
jgi:tetratricopeptide (TPR) repeat protein